MLTIEDGDLKITSDASVDGLMRLDLYGKSNARNPGAILLPYFESVLSVCVDQARHLVLHFEHIEHFNSSTITAIVQLVRLARSRSIHLQLIYNSSLHWQRASFEALNVLAGDDSALEIIGIAQEEPTHAPGHI